MSELAPSIGSGVYSASGAEIFERLVVFFCDMLSHLMDNDFFIIIIGVLCVLLVIGLFRRFRKVLV